MCCLLLQDVLRLDNSARMNSPGKAAGNWMWRIGDSGVWDRMHRESNDLRRLAYLSNRLPPGMKWEG